MSLAINPTLKSRPQLDILFPEKVQPLFIPCRYKILWGGRGSAKSWSVARALIMIAHSARKRIGCFREVQASIKDSVHQLLKTQIELLGLSPWFKVSDESIRSTITGSEFIFKGLRHNATEIKSMEGIDIAWIEEAELVTHDSWEILIPTIRKEGSEIWVTFNPAEEKDSTYQRFVVHPPPNAWVIKLYWYDNPWFSSTLNEERLHLLATDPDAYEWVWNGNCRTQSEAMIFRGKCVFETFDTPDRMRFFHGLDFGFAADPTAGTRSYIVKVDLPREEMERRAQIEIDQKIKLPPIRSEDLYIDYEAFGYNVEINETDKLLDSVPTFRTWPIKADNARPETISHLRNMGFNVSAADKWPGCVEDRIAHIKGFHRIHIHNRCEHMKQEASLYKWKVDKVTNEILPIPVDKHNHGWDSVGYGLDQYIKRRGALGVWANL